MRDSAKCEVSFTNGFCGVVFRREVMMRFLYVVLVLPLLGWTFLDPVAKKNEEGNAMFEQGAYEEALKRYLEAQQGGASRPELHFNAGDALYKQGKYAEAMQEMGRAVEVEHPGLSAAAHYNLGNALFRQEKFQEAVGAYKKALEIKPDDVDSKINLELALEKLNQQNQNKDQNQDQDQKEDQQDQNEEEQDQQDQQQQNQNQQQEDKQQDQQSQQQQPDPKKLTPEEAAQILDAMKAREAESQKRRKLRLLGRRYTGNAW
jgi:Ca-activated chloride channel family protein